MAKGKYILAKRRAYRFYWWVLPMLLAICIQSQTALAKTYVIRDGSRILTYTTFATDPAQILDAAGVALNGRDCYHTESADGVESITVNRCQRITVSHYGEEMQVDSFGESVAQLLKRLNLHPAPEDILSHSKDSQTYDGMVLRIDTVLQQQESYAAAIAHETRYCTDASLPLGVQREVIAGRDGELLCTANVTYTNGLATHREILRESVTLPPVTQVIAVGTGELPAAAPQADSPVIEDGYIRLPTGEILTYTHTAQIRATAYTHTDAGCDFITATGTTVHIGTVAVDPRYIPYGTRMFIVSNDGAYVYGISVAEDCGGDIKGDRMDLYFPTFSQCIQFGRRTCTVYFLG